MKRWSLPTPWSRAPLMLRHQLSVAFAVAAAAFLVALPASAAFLFLSSAGNATLHNQLDNRCQWLTGAQFTASLPFSTTARAQRFNAENATYGAALVEDRARTVDALAGQVPRLSAPVMTLLIDATVTPAAGNAAQPDSTSVQLTARDHYPEHLQVLSGGDDRQGIWLSDRFAETQQLRVGDMVTVTAGPDPVTMPVAAVYRDLRSLPDQPFWCSMTEYYRGKPFSESPVYPLAMVPRDTFLAATQGNSAPAVNLVEMSVRTDGLTTSAASPVIAGLQRLNAGTMGDRDETSGAFRPVYPTDYISSLDGDTSRAGLVVGALTGTVVPLAAAGALAGLVIAAAGGAFWIDRRRSEVAVLSARGVGPAAVGGKAILETGIVAAIGTAAGWLAARLLVSAVGPTPLVTTGATMGSVAGAAIAFAATLATIGLVSAGRARGLLDTHPTRSGRLGRVPWEVLPLAAAALCWQLLDASSRVGVSGAHGTVAHIPPRLIVVPILIVIGLAMLGGRLLLWILGRARPTGPPTGRRGLFLAGRRIAAAPTMVAILAGATAVPVALSVYGATVTGSVDRTLAAEAQLIVGSDVVIALDHDVPMPQPLADQATMVKLYDSAHIAGTTVHLLGVDPASFANAAFWDPLLPGPSLDSLLDQLGDGTQQTPVGILAGTSSPAAATVEAHGNQQPMRIVSAGQLPGETSGYSVLLVHEKVFERLVDGAEPQLWARGDPDQILAATTAAELPVRTISEARDVHASGVYAGITYTFTFLAAVSLLSGAIIAVGLLLYLDARARVRRSAYVLLRRMAVSAAAHWRALLLEVGGVLLAGFVLGLVLAGIVIVLTYQRFDVNAGTMPDTLVVLPWPLIGGLAIAAAATTAIAAAAAQHTASRANPAEVLRDTR